MTSRKTHRTLMLILVSWAGTLGVTVAEHWPPWAWVVVAISGLTLWIGGKAVAVGIAAMAGKWGGSHVP